MKLNKETKKQLLDLWHERRIALEGNILKVIDSEGDDEFQKYIDEALNKAESAKEEAESARIEAEKAKIEAENAKLAAENDLDLIQKKTQFELIGTIIRVALWVILGVGIVTTAVYLIALFTGVDTAVIGSTWSNIIGILLTNSFSIVGTIMGVKYASESKEKAN